MSFTFPQQGSIILLWVTTSTSVLKSHTGATQALTGARESWLVCRKSRFVHYYSFFFVFGLWHKANSAFQALKFLSNCWKTKKLTWNRSFSELTSHTTKEISSASCPVFCRKYPSPWKSAVFLCRMLCAWPEADRLYHSCTLGCWKMRNSKKDA